MQKLNVIAFFVMLSKELKFLSAQQLEHLVSLECSISQVLNIPSVWFLECLAFQVLNSLSAWLIKCLILECTTISMCEAYQVLGFLSSHLPKFLTFPSVWFLGVLESVIPCMNRFNDLHSLSMSAFSTNSLYYLIINSV